jgi:anthranilate synthase component I
MKKIKINTTTQSLLADMHTPVSVYLKLRDHFPYSCLLESSDYHGTQDIYSYIGCEPLASFKVENGILETVLPGCNPQTQPAHRENVTEALSDFINSFDTKKSPAAFITSGLFGYLSYDAVRYFEQVEISTFENDDRKIPEVYYLFYRYLLVFNHFNNELTIVENQLENKLSGPSQIEKIKMLVNNQNVPEFHFSLTTPETSNLTDDEFLAMIDKGKQHCRRGDVFQIVLSRRFQRGYAGDDFNVYRSLRSINPSPYLFYFDYGSFRIFGSSPEAQIVIKDDAAFIFPIAGTFRRTGDDVKDYDLAKELLNDPKENAEHVMLVDLARNDLSRHGEQVKVETFKEVQYYSHVIHLVSKVKGILENPEDYIQVVADTFPAGTLSGAPKHRAMQLIDQYEKSNRGFYGGAIGYIGFNGEFNHAIMIRSILSKYNQLYYQAGAGVVDLSVRESELQEVHNKLAAVKKAIEQAVNL